MYKVPKPTLICLCILVLWSFSIAWGPDYSDIDYGGNGNSAQCLDIYLPDGEGPFPVVIYFFGGCWTMGNKSAAIQFEFMNDSGLAVVGVQYRYSQDSIWPAQSHDIKGAVRWIRANADTYNFKAGKIGATGESAGGHLAAFLGTSGDIGDTTIGSETMNLEGSVGGNTEYSSAIQAVAEFFGPSDFLLMEDPVLVPDHENDAFDHDSPTSPESKLVTENGGIQDFPDRCAFANPITFVDKNDPPFHIFHGTEDNLVPISQSVLLDNALDSVGVKSDLTLVQGGGHDATTKSKENMKIAASFFVEHLIRNQTPIHKEIIPKNNSGIALCQRNNAIILNLEKAGDVLVTLYDLHGKTIEKLFDGSARKGSTRLTFDYKKYDNRIYLVKVSTNKGSIIQKLALIR